MEIDALVNKVIFEISNRHIQPGYWRSLGWVRKKSKICSVKKFEVTANRGLDSQQCEGKCLSAYHKNSKNFQHMLLFYFLFWQIICETSYGWGCSRIHVSVKYDECSDYFSWPYMHLLLVFSSSCAFSYCFASDGVPRQLRMGSHQRRME